MTNTKKLKARLVEKGMSQTDAANAIGISYQSFNSKLRNAIEFKASEIEKLCDILDISDKDAYFFCNQISQNG